MNWNDLLSTKRLGEDIDIPYNQTQYAMSEFEKDYWRIISCSAFRRLQDKTQVFPLEKNDFIRTRLTHSLEVSVIAKQLVAMIYKNINTYAKSELKERYPFTAENAQYAADVVACAGLLHDIGNPPFGHFGEEVMHAWFENHLDKLSYFDEEKEADIKLTKEQIIADLEHFEGNAQAFRLLTKLHDVDSEYGLNLTSAVLNTLVKYPTDSMHIDASAENVCVHKLGCYYADWDMFDEVTKNTGTQFDHVFHRHPLTFILEAADDIAYATADLEDSYKKGLFSIDSFCTFFENEIKKIASEKQRSYSDILLSKLRIYKEESIAEKQPEMKAFQKWINYVRHWLIYCAAYGFTQNYKAIMEGNYYNEIIYNTHHESSMNIMKKSMKEFTYCSDGIIKLELSAQTIIEGLLERFVFAAIDWDVPSRSRMTSHKAQKKLMTLVSENHKAAYQKYKSKDDKEYNLYLRILLIADFISGMTDTFARTLYQELSGI